MGKSTASDRMKALDIPVLDTDQIARELVKPGQPCLKEIAKAFGNEVLFPDGSLNRSSLGKMVFSDSGKKAELESILHPVIRKEWKLKVAQWQAAEVPRGVVVIPLLFETHTQDEFDSVICVACSEETQMQRCIQRGWSRDHCQQRIKAQWPVTEKMNHSEFVIWTEGRLEVYEPQIYAILMAHYENFV